MNINIDLLRQKKKSNSIIYVTGVGVTLVQGLFLYPEMSKQRTAVFIYIKVTKSVKLVHRSVEL